MIGKNRHLCGIYVLQPNYVLLKSSCCVLQWQMKTYAKWLTNSSSLDHVSCSLDKKTGSETADMWEHQEPQKGYMSVPLRTWAGWRGGRRSPQRDPPVKRRWTVTQFFPSVAHALHPKAVSLSQLAHAPTHQEATSASLLVADVPGDPLPAWPYRPSRGQKKDAHVAKLREGE